MEETTVTAGTKKKKSRGLRRFGSDSLVLVLMLAVITLLSIAVVWPLWLLATRATTLYSLLCILALIAAVAASIILRARSKSKASSL